jgi:SLOG in TRPM, prokaryote
VGKPSADPSDHTVARHVRVHTVAHIPQALDRMGLRRGRPVVVIVGGASGMDTEDLEAIREVLERDVLPLLAAHSTVIVDGGTNSGIMAALGQAREASGLDVPLIGVAAEGTVAAPGAGGPDAATLEPRHTFAVLVPGDAWGDESPWLGHVADAIAQDHPSATVVVNGGEITYADAAASLARGRPVIVLAGTGRTADAIAAARSGQPADPRAMQIAAPALTKVVDYRKITPALRAALDSTTRQRR